MTKENNKVDINKHEIDIDTLKKQNVNDLLSIKELYKRIEELGDKITQVKYIDNTLVKKIKKEYGNLKNIILDENIQVKLTNDIETINSQLNTKASKDVIETINSQLDTIAKNKTNWINVVEYGIDNTGIKDVTLSLQNLINNNAGCIIYLPAGTYLISQIKLPKGTTLLGDGIDSTILKGTSATDMIILKDYLSAHVRIKDIFIDGDYKANRGVFAYKEQYSIEYLDNAFNMDNVYIKRCNVANVQIGKEDTTSIMECKITNVKCEQGKGVGLYLANKCTDSFFEGIYCASNEGGGIHSNGYNLKFVNCKVCWNGTKENRKSGVYINKGSLHTFINFESQDNYGHGLFADTTVDLNVQGIFDRNGNGGFDSNGTQIAPDIPEKYGVYLKNSNFVNLNIIATNEMYSVTGKYTQKASLGFTNCKNVNANIVASHHKYYFINEDNESYNIDVNVNGHKWINILPNISIEDTTQNGVTFKQINNNTFSINGTATNKTKIDLLGVYGNSTPLLTIPANSILKIKNANIETNVYLLVVANKTTILANVTKEKYVLIEENTNLSEVALQVNSGKVINNVFVMPTFEIIPLGSK